MITVNFRVKGRRQIASQEHMPLDDLDPFVALPAPTRRVRSLRRRPHTSALPEVALMKPTNIVLPFLGTLALVSCSGHSASNSAFETPSQGPAGTSLGDGGAGPGTTAARALHRSGTSATVR